MPTRQQIQELSRRVLPQPQADRFLQLLRPSARIRAVHTDQEVPVLLGGPGVLPAGTPWPEWEGIPLDFLACFDCASVRRILPDAPIPATGTFSFFAEASLGAIHPSGRLLGALDTGSRDGWRVIYIPEHVPIERVHVPHGATRWFADRQVGGVLELDWTWPDPWVYPDVAGVFEEEEDLLGPLQELAGTARHRIGGWTDSVQGDPAAEVALAAAGVVDGTGRVTFADAAQVRAATTGAHDSWFPLLQLDTDDGADGVGWIWGDAGVLWFFGTPDDLRAAHVGDIWLTWNCH